MSEDYTFAEGYTFTQIVALWDCNPHDVAFIAAKGYSKAYWQNTETFQFVEADCKDTEITAIDIESNETVYCCNNCGSDSLESAAHIKHNSGCKPGEAAYWTNFYSEYGEGADHYNYVEEGADECPFDGSLCWHWVQGHCIHINGVVPEGKPCSRHPDGKGGDVGD